MERSVSLPEKNLQPYLSHEEYFALEEGLQQKFEYVAGEVFAMTGGSVSHGSICANSVTTLMKNLWDKPCRVFGSDVKLHINDVDSFFYPDAMVLCEDGEIDEKHVQSPQIIIEVLSPSTSDYDHGKKFAYYRQIKTLQTYVMLHQDKPLAEVYQRCDDNAWLLNEYIGLDVVITINDDLTLSMADLYRKIEFNLSS
ncbi:MAG TPA: Uma2 family endonuclease [Leucothrix mucor]|nr:Uma2 family endonuclease [Leucothrix mucor]